MVIIEFITFFTAGMGREIGHARLTRSSQATEPATELFCWTQDIWNEKTSLNPSPDIGKQRRSNSENLGTVYLRRHALHY